MQPDPDKMSRGVREWLDREGWSVVDNHPSGKPCVRNAAGEERLLAVMWKTQTFPWKAKGRVPMTGMAQPALNAGRVGLSSSSALVSHAGGHGPRRVA